MQADAFRERGVDRQHAATIGRRTMWINIEQANENRNDRNYRVGDVAFLWEIFNTSDASYRRQIGQQPAHTNRSNEPRLHGWCGETDNRSITALGMVRVARIAANGRAQLAELRGEALAAAAMELGYPELV
jgi:hypothetical protein